MSRLLQAFILAVTLAGCATTPVSDSEAEPVQALAFARSESANTAIMVTRDSGFANAGATARIMVDGKEAVNLRPSQQARIYVVPGEHIVAVGQNSANAQASVQTITSIDHERRFRVGGEPGRFFLLPQ